MHSGPLDDLVSAHSSRLSSYLFALMEEDQGGDGLDAKLAGQGLFFFCVDLCQTDVGLKEACGLVKGGAHHFTGPTPGGPEVDEDRNVVATHMALEKGTGKIYRGLTKQGLRAFSTFGIVTEADGGDTVFRGTGWADNMKRGIHDVAHSVEGVSFEHMHTLKV